MKAYLLHRSITGQTYLTFGEDCVSCAKVLSKKLNCDEDDFSVGANWEVGPDEPINIMQLWPYFTSNKPRGANY